MRGFKPDAKLWARVNVVIMGESAANVLTTFISAMCQLIIQAGVCADESQARVHLAAMILSPDSDERAGSLLPQLQAEFARLSDGKWIT